MPKCIGTALQQSSGRTLGAGQWQMENQRLCPACMRVASLMSEAGMRAPDAHRGCAAGDASTETLKRMPCWEALLAPSQGCRVHAPAPSRAWAGAASGARAGPGHMHTLTLTLTLTLRATNRRCRPDLMAWLHAAGTRTPAPTQAWSGPVPLPACTALINASITPANGTFNQTKFFSQPPLVRDLLKLPAAC